MVVLVNAYSGVLTSLLTVPKLTPIAQTLKDVAEKELKVIVKKNEMMGDLLLVILVLIQINSMNNLLLIHRMQ